MQNILTLETKKYSIKLENFEGPLDLLCHLVDKNKMDIYKVNISEIADQYIEYINKLEKSNLDITSEFLIMASTLLFIKSKGLLPQEVEDEAEISEEELIRRIIDYKKYKEISKRLKDSYEIYSKLPDEIQLPKQKIEKQYEMILIYNKYKELMEREKQKFNQNAKNIEKLAVYENVSVTTKVKEIFKELLKKPKFVFGKLFSLKTCSKTEVVTAFTGVLELNRRKKITATQEELFGDITIEKTKK